MVNVAGAPGAAWAEAGAALPEAQDSVTVTDVVFASEYTFSTTKVTLARMLLIVHEPVLRLAPQVAVEV
jgi:hypothetical protein